MPTAPTRFKPKNQRTNELTPTPTSTQAHTHTSEQTKRNSFRSRTLTNIQTSWQRSKCFLPWQHCCSGSGRGRRGGVAARLNCSCRFSFCLKSLGVESSVCKDKDVAKAISFHYAPYRSFICRKMLYDIKVQWNRNWSTNGSNNASPPRLPLRFLPPPVNTTLWLENNVSFVRQCVSVRDILSHSYITRRANKWKTIVSEKNFLSEFLIRSDQKVRSFAILSFRHTRTCNCSESAAEWDGGESKDWQQCSFAKQCF